MYSESIITDPMIKMVGFEVAMFSEWFVNDACRYADNVSPLSYKRAAHYLSYRQETQG